MKEYIRELSLIFAILSVIPISMARADSRRDESAYDCKCIDTYEEFDACSGEVGV